MKSKNSVKCLTKQDHETEMKKRLPANQETSFRLYVLNADGKY